MICETGICACRSEKAVSSPEPKKSEDEGAEAKDKSVWDLTPDQIRKIEYDRDMAAPSRKPQEAGNADGK